MTHTEWLAVCATISRLWPHAPMPPEAADAWYPLLADLDGDQVAAAVQRFAVDGDQRFPPSVGAIRELAEPAGRDWHEALGDLRKLAARHGAYDGKPPIDDPALDAVADSYGWQGLCSIDVTDPAARAQFRDAYQAAQHTQRRRRREQAVALATSDDEPAAAIDPGRSACPPRT